MFHLDSRYPDSKNFLNPKFDRWDCISEPKREAMAYFDDDYEDSYDSYDYEDDSYEGSDSDVDALANGLSGVSLANKLSIIDCGDCFSCTHIRSCNKIHCIDCVKIVNEIGCQNKWCDRHNCRENALKCSCTTERLLLKYENGTKSVFGHFRCKRCKKSWNSALAWIEYGELLKQDCKRCNNSMRPFKVVSD